ncbi:DUF3806 domain-containing protein [Corynebacterium liangguodongii]|uniref:DUF3806 domain-containing protein n=1 Tax=Corynebacterium liangguodongii TaxID=2079535 RepID=A0A2S0WD47_9CORY|nr:DUF3806 domain-containing protein [Corynebacterium liangguodongii]AWB83686.1 hypothetical protein C3E79_03615 [Corynebacterium liangguodongii]PWB99504.1 DUF3806 domain-containing protein [Corynebacterium liangguodongii]
MASETFSDIDAATRAQIDADLAAASTRGISGGIDDIVESFESVVTEFLSLDAERKRSYPRGETARIFGTALGDALVRDHNFAWRLLSDDYGTDLVVARGEGSEEEKYTAPIVVVDLRFDDEEPGRLRAFITQFL